jgi:hypothetical protein
LPHDVIVATKLHQLARHPKGVWPQEAGLKRLASRSKRSPVVNGVPMASRHPPQMGGWPAAAKKWQFRAGYHCGTFLMRAVARIFLLLSFAALSACTTSQSGDGNFINSGFVSVCQSLLIGCAPSGTVIVWRRPHGTLEQFEEDKAACQVEAEKVSFSRGFNSWDFFKPDNPALVKCLKARGYSRTSQRADLSR